MDNLPPSVLLLRRLEDAVATQSPTEQSTRQQSRTSSNSNGNRNANYSSTEPLLTTGEKIGAFIIVTISLLIGVYFFLLSVRVRRYRKRRQGEKISRRKNQRKDSSSEGWKRHAEKGDKTRRRPREIAEREDEQEDSASLTVLSGGGDFYNDNLEEGGSDNALITGIVALPPTLRSLYNHNHTHKNHNHNHNHNNNNKDAEKEEDDDTKASTAEIEMASAYSLSSEDGSPRRISPTRKGQNQNKPSKKKKVRHDGSQSYKRLSTLTNAVLNAIHPDRSNDEEHQENKSSYYIRHEDEDEAEQDNSDNDDSTISSPFHPSPAPKIGPPQVNRKRGQTATYFLHQNDSVLRQTVSTTDTSSTGDFFHEVSDRPFDCETETFHSSEDRPFDCV